MKRKFWNWTKNEGVPGERTLFLNGEISDETWFGDDQKISAKKATDNIPDFLKKR